MHFLPHPSLFSALFLFRSRQSITLPRRGNSRVRSCARTLAARRVRTHVRTHAGKVSNLADDRPAGGRCMLDAGTSESAFSPRKHRLSGEGEGERNRSIEGRYLDALREGSSILLDVLRVDKVVKALNNNTIVLAKEIAINRSKREGINKQAYWHKSIQTYKHIMN